jgi:transposase
LDEAIAQAFTQHSDYKVLISFPGLGNLTGSRLLAEIGDDRTRLADARPLKVYAGAAPVTRASGKSRRANPLAPRRIGSLARRGAAR